MAKAYLRDANPHMNIYYAENCARQGARAGVAAHGDLVDVAHIWKVADAELHQAQQLAHWGQDVGNIVRPRGVPLWAMRQAT